MVTDKLQLSEPAQPDQPTELSPSSAMESSELERAATEVEPEAPDRRTPRIVDRRRPAAVTASEKRFKVGDRVLALIKGSVEAFGTTESRWRVGTVMQLDYTEDGWASDDIAPYQILLDSACRASSRKVFAPNDDDTCVRAIPASGIKASDAEETLMRCTDEGEACPLNHHCKHGLECPSYHCCGKDGKRKTRMRRKLLQRTQAVGRKHAHQPGEQCNEHCATPQPDIVSLEELLAFVQGDEEDKTGQKKPVAGRTKKSRKKECTKAKPAARKPLRTRQQDTAAGPDPMPPDSSPSSVASAVTADSPKQEPELAAVSGSDGPSRAILKAEIVDPARRDQTQEEEEQHTQPEPSVPGEQWQRVRKSPRCSSRQQPADLVDTPSDEAAPQVTTASNSEAIAASHSPGGASSLGPALEARRAARNAEIATLEARVAALRKEQAADDELQRQWPQLSSDAGTVSSVSWEADGRCCASHECLCEGMPEPAVVISGPAHSDCDCECHDIVKAGRATVLAKLVEGVDFSPLFRAEEFETADIDTEQEQALKDFERTLTRAHGWCAVAKAC